MTEPNAVSLSFLTQSAWTGEACESIEICANRDYSAAYVSIAGRVCDDAVHMDLVISIIGGRRYRSLVDRAFAEIDAKKRDERELAEKVEVL